MTADNKGILDRYLARLDAKVRAAEATQDRIVDALAATDAAAKPKGPTFRLPFRPVTKIAIRDLRDVQVGEVAEVRTPRGIVRIKVLERKLSDEEHG